ncbi:unnamed protein product [Dicrocoelium dendriticum]|nr:unnamed protein product [Dicrocoelium dendriticum]
MHCDTENLLDPSPMGNKCNRRGNNVLRPVRRTNTHRFCVACLVLTGLLTFILLLFGASVVLRSYYDNSRQKLPSLNPKCTQQIQPGSGADSSLKWAWNTVLRDCVEFNFSGSGGNENQFATKEECQKLCETRVFS